MPNLLDCEGDGEEKQPSEDGPLPPALARAPGDGPLTARLHDEDVPRVQGERTDEEGQEILIVSTNYVISLQSENNVNTLA